jgi:hypothetical protein
MTGSKNDQVTRAGNEHLELFNAMEKSTDRMLAALRASDFAKLERLLEIREDLCQRIGNNSQALAILLTQIEDLPADSRRESEELIGQIKMKEGLLLAKQAECEAFLSDSLGKCREELSSLSQRRDLQEVYQGSCSAAQDARFLDSKL